jgi:cbb3-type cytochrome oxidase subunit 1
MREDIRRRVRLVTKVAWIVLAVLLVLVVAISVAAPEGLFGAMWSTFYRIATIAAGVGSPSGWPSSVRCTA